MRRRARRRPLRMSVAALFNHVNNHLTYGFASYRVHRYGRRRR